jgi:hypothetical protein
MQRKRNALFVLTTLRHRIQRAQQRAKMRVAAGTSLADELIAERRKAAKNE